MFEDVFADHNRIVDHNSHRHQKREHRQHVERLVVVEQNGSCPEDADRNPYATQKANRKFKNMASSKKTMIPPWIPLLRSIRIRSRTSTLSSPHALKP